MIKTNFGSQKIVKQGKFADFQNILSPERLNRYVAACGNDTRKAMSLYRLNLHLSQEVFKKPYTAIVPRQEHACRTQCSVDIRRRSLRRLADEGRLNEWAEASIGWAKQTFGEDNVVGAHLHMDEQTPHLHVTIVPIVTTERKRKAS